MHLTKTQASEFVKLPLRGLRQEYPNAPGLVLNGRDDIKSPRELHPAFFGCFDWHSAVHGHWMLVRLLRRFQLSEAEEICDLLNQSLTAENLRIEADYFAQPNRQSFERPYGWAWLLKLAEELRGGDFPEWSANLQPLESVIVDRYLDYLPKQTYPIRSGLHSNSAFGLSFAYDYAVSSRNSELQELISERARGWFVEDVGYPAKLEPSGSDFLSPSLVEADLMRRILPQDEFARWFESFLPSLASEKSLLTPAVVSDRIDPQIGHLDGLNLSRAWCMRSIANALPDNATKSLLIASAEQHTEAGLEGVFFGDYAGEHWLASFATYLLTSE